MEEESKRMEGKLERKRKVMVKEEMGQTNIVNQSSINYKQINILKNPKKWDLKASDQEMNQEAPWPGATWDGHKTMCPCQGLEFLGNIFCLTLEIK